MQVLYIVGGIFGNNKVEGRQSSIFDCLTITHERDLDIIFDIVSRVYPNIKTEEPTKEQLINYIIDMKL